MKYRIYLLNKAALFIFIFISLFPTLASAAEIHDSVLNGDIGRVKRLLRKEPSLVNKKDECGWTPLSLAAMTGSEDMVRLLLSRGANVRDKNELGWTPLHMASSIEAARLLVAAGADMNAGDWHQCTPFNYAPTAMIAEFLNTKGARKRWDYYGHTHLNSASECGNIKVIDFFLSHGSDINAKDRKGETPLGSAVVSTGSEELKLEAVKYLISQGADVNVNSRYGWTLLQTAAYDSISDVVECLVSHGAKINIISGNEDTPLSLASRPLLFYGHHQLNSSTYQDISDKKRIIDILIDHGAEIHTITEAIAAGDVEKVESFLRKDPSMLTHLDYFNTTLHCAAFWGRTKVAEFLLKNGAPLETSSCHGTPLNVAAMMGNKDIVKLLISHGANVNSAKMTGYTPIVYAILYNHWGILSTYDDPHERDAATPSSAKHTKTEDFMETVKLLASAGADLKLGTHYFPIDSFVRQNIFPCLLQIAVERNNKDMIECLLYHDADPDIKNDRGMTLLRYAIEKGYTDIADLLKKHGARE